MVVPFMSPFFDFSCMLCLCFCLGCSLTGTHVSNTSEIGAFKVVGESGVASGVRRIEAVAGQAAVEYLQALDVVVKQLAGNLKVKTEDLPARVTALQVGLVEPPQEDRGRQHAAGLCLMHLV